MNFTFLLTIDSSDHQQCAAFLSIPLSLFSELLSSEHVKFISTWSPVGSLKNSEIQDLLADIPI